jgi:hypothetical protein
MYPLLVKTYGIVGEGAKLSSPISRKWAGFAEILSRGFSALPPYALRECFHHDIVSGLLHPMVSPSQLC